MWSAKDCCPLSCTSWNESIWTNRFMIYCDILWLRVVSSFLLQICLFYQDYSGHFFKSRPDHQTLYIYIYLYIHIYILDIMTYFQYIHTCIYIYKYAFEIFTRIFLQTWRVLQVYPSEEIVGTLVRKDPTAVAQLRRSKTTCCDYEASETWEMRMNLEGMTYGYDMQSIYCSSYRFCIYKYIYICLDCLGGGNSNIFLFSPRSLGKWSNLTSIFFQMGGSITK